MSGSSQPTEWWMVGGSAMGWGGGGIAVFAFQASGGWSCDMCCSMGGWMCGKESSLSQPAAMRRRQDIANFYNTQPPSQHPSVIEVKGGGGRAIDHSEVSCGVGYACTACAAM